MSQQNGTVAVVVAVPVLGTVSGVRPARDMGRPAPMDAKAPAVETRPTKTKSAPIGGGQVKAAGPQVR